MFKVLHLFVLAGLTPSVVAPISGQAIGTATPEARCDGSTAATITSEADLHCMTLYATAAGGPASGSVELGPAPSPFGVAVTPDGTHRWEITLNLAALPDPSTLGATAYVAWVTTPSLTPVIRLGEVTDGRNVLGEIAFNKFTIWVSAEPDRDSPNREGSLVLRGISPSSRMQPEDLITQSPMSMFYATDAMGDDGEGASTMHHGETMPPMHPAVPPLPGLMALRPTVDGWLPASPDPSTVPFAQPRQVISLGDGGTLDLESRLVRREIGSHTLLMYGFNGQYPGPLLRVPENATIFVNFRNSTALPTAVHWHGVRLDNRFDGVPGVTQEPVMPGETFRYQVYFRDAGIYWYHPHHREDITQDLGLYGNMLVEPVADDYYNAVDGESVLMLDDLLLGDAGLVPYGETAANYMLMGRFGNVLLINGEPSFRESAQGGDVRRFYFTNVSNTRTFNLSFRPIAWETEPADFVSGQLGGAEWALDAAPLPLRVVGADISRFERESWADSLAIAPAERYVIEVQMPAGGEVVLVNAVQAINHRTGSYFTEATEMGRIVIDGINPSPRRFDELRRHPEVVSELRALRSDFGRPVDHELVLRLQINTLPLLIEQLMALDRVFFNPVEWSGTMPMMNWVSSRDQVAWQLFEPSTNRVDDAIQWSFEVGDIVKIRLRNDRSSFHAMQHPVHFHGQRFLVLERDGVRNDNLAWKDTVLVPVGSTVDLLLELSNPGKWMVHCHIAEHLESGMKMTFVVNPADNAPPQPEEPER